MMDLDALEPGTRVAQGRFEIIRRLGKGGMATVYLARSTEISAHVALKVLSKERARRADIQLRFQNEVRIAAELPPHPNIVRPFEIGRLSELDGRPYMAMEFAQGPTLADLVVAKPLPVDQACALIGDVAQALVFLHERGIVHRDVKPTNVIVTTCEGRQCARLLDFGYAFELGAPGVGPASRLTQVDERPGTKHYMAPEQARGEPPNPSFDIYALAASLFEVLVGDPPGHELTPREVVLRKCDARRPPFSIAGKRGDLPDSLVALVDDGLQREANARIPTASVFRDRIAMVLDARPVESSVGLPLPPVAVHSRPWGRFVALAAVATLVAALGVGLWQSINRDAALATPARAPGVLSPHTAESASPAPTVGAPAAAQTSAVLEEDSGDSDETEPMPESSSGTSVGPALPSEPSVGPKGPGTKKKRHVPKTPPAAPGKTCQDTPDKALAAEHARQWGTIARLTERRSCWPSERERVRLRVLALYRLGRYRECAALDGQSSHSEAQRMIALCKAKRDQEPSP